MNLEKTRITPFPFPDHLAQFLMSQLNTPVEYINGVQTKALHIKNDRILCKTIIRSLKKSDRPIVVKEGITLYVSFSKHVRRHDKACEEARFTDMYLPPEAITYITEFFETLFRLCLVNYIDGAKFGNDYKKGKHHKSINEFMKKYKLQNSPTAFEKYNQMYKRAKRTSKSIVNTTF
ncbi:hypothetical protein AXE80_10805 [Wenyingzhuangia fucanilytica]|uniref:Uncharacterized protein n=1 Tax=Wenyingzhuangia fucanilytica TaxID=1790137 RepID=A0A1B1Y7I2_9FLAO|nr:hypothetical protein [Wenyingzhuangia fucanilytica]ANW96733.1 hypothetical protein AXE80_10805 [Wenyingzhuangia fucanilytica]